MKKFLHKVVSGLQWSELSKSDVGLANVDNTSDLDKPISTATQSALDAKSTLALGTTSSTAYRGDYGNTAYTHSQVTHAPSNAQKNSDITKAEIEAKLTGEISTHTHGSSSSPTTPIITLAGTEINCSLGVYFVYPNINLSRTFTFTNAPQNVAFSFTLMVSTLSGANLYFPSTVRWPNGLTGNEVNALTNLPAYNTTFVFLTHNGGGLWFGSFNTGYVV